MPSFTIISNAFAIIKSSEYPVLVDVDLDTWNIKIDDIEKKITKKTKCIMLPHIYGLANDMNKILKLVKKYKLYLIEDAAEVFGLKYKNKYCGSFGDISISSLCKCYNDRRRRHATTNSKKLNKKFRDYRNLCFAQKKDSTTMM